MTAEDRHQKEDEVAVERILAGDVSSFEDIVRRWQKPLINLAYRFCRDRSRASSDPETEYTQNMREKLVR
jgi:RNA polymerase sigma-70 factor (ECF subfamily)